MKIVTVVGARPQFVKMGPVSRALAGRHHEVVVHTGQHYSARLSARLWSELGIGAPDHNLRVGSGPHGAQTGLMMQRIERVLCAERPDLVLVYGDTNSTLAGALAAAKLRVPVGHVEAGLRSFNRDMPEELNRVLTDHCSTLLFTPTKQASANLRSEGIRVGVHHVGDVMFDQVRTTLPAAVERFGRLASRLRIKTGDFYLATIHRAENTDRRERLAGIVDALVNLDAPVVVPLHPRTRKMLTLFGLEGRVRSGGMVRLIAPVGYVEMLALEREARVILTDSGGVQKEGYFVGTPVVTLRDETEWPETVIAGWNVVAGTEPERIVAAVRRRRDLRKIQDYGGGVAASRLVSVIDRFGATSQP